MSHQPTRTSDIASEWPEERKKKASRFKSAITPTLSSKAAATLTSSSTAGPNDSDGDVNIPNIDELPEWDARSCLFCPSHFPSSDLTLQHMADVHSLTILEEDHLIVDLETLLGYVHVVVSGYLECPMCGTQRQTLKPLQAHMRDKGHCGFSIEQEDSDFRVFYDFADEGDGKDEEGVEEEDESEERGTEKRAGGMENLEIGDGQVRLPSGRVVGSKTYRAPRPVKEAKTTEEEMLQDGPNPSSSCSRQPATTFTPSSDRTEPQKTALTRADRRSAVTLTALSHLRDADRMQLAHLAPAQQRALLGSQKKQAAKERRAINWMEGRVKGKGNKFLQARYRADGPGRANG